MQRKELGRGRSAVVYRGRDAEGRDVASKVFVGDRAAKLVNYVLTGAPNAYTWNGDAVRCALLRRQIVAELMRLWFGDGVEVADAYDTSWNEPTKTFALDTRFVSGRPASLDHPFSGPRRGEYRDLRRRVMRPLQRHLVEAGLDGLVWQAGRGNPVAVNNFLYCGSPGHHRWSWIDLESGIPALVPLNPLDLLGFYIPKSFHHRRPLFDDVDIEKLRSYVARRSEEIHSLLGPDRSAQLDRRIGELEHHQRLWRSLSRVSRGVGYRLVKGQITEEQAEWFRERPLRWHAREFRRGSAHLVAGAFGLVGKGLRWLAGVDYVAALRRVGRFLVSQQYRAQLGRDYVSSRIRAWVQRRQIEEPDAEVLVAALEREGTGSYITDFGVHVSIKPAIKFVQWVVMPAMLASGLIGAGAAGVVIVFGGMIGRSIYTLGRSVQAVLAGQRIPWVAFVVGLLPIAGNIAFPSQLVYESAGRDGRLAAFVLYASITRVGEKTPIWGGADTGVEHFFNRIADLIIFGRTA